MESALQEPHALSLRRLHRGPCGRDRRHSFVLRRPEMLWGVLVSSVGLSEDDWDTLLRKIHAKERAPFIGAGASAGTVPLASELAERWANGSVAPEEPDGSRTGRA